MNKKNKDLCQNKIKWSVSEKFKMGNLSLKILKKIICLCKMNMALRGYQMVDALGIAAYRVVLFTTAERFEDSVMPMT